MIQKLSLFGNLPIIWQPQVRLLFLFYLFVFFFILFLLSAVVNKFLRLFMLIISNDIHALRTMKQCVRASVRERVGSASVASEHSSNERVSSSSISSINTFCHINLLLLLSLLLLLLLWLLLVVIMCCRSYTRISRNIERKREHADTLMPM